MLNVALVGEGKVQETVKCYVILQRMLREEKARGDEGTPGEGCQRQRGTVSIPGEVMIPNTFIRVGWDTLVLQLKKT